MRVAVLALLMLMGLAQSSSAAVVFFLSPTSSTILQGNTANFDVFVRSTLVAGEQVDGLEASVTSTAGLFTSGSTFLLNNGAVDLSTPGQAFMSNFAVGGFNLTNSNTLFATLSLSTVGVTPGTYSMAFDAGSLAANSPTLGGLGIVDSGPISFTVTAVPEPSSTVFLLGLVGGAYALRRKRRAAKLAADELVPPT